MSRFLDKVLTYRKENSKECHNKIKNMLPGSLRSAFTYVTMLEHKDRPDYNLMKLYLAFD
jgi:hypothetical protein